MNTDPSGRSPGNHAKRRSEHGTLQSGLVPLHLNYGDAVEFVYLTMSALNMLSGEAPVQQYIRAEPDAHRAILALCRAVTQAGIRVRNPSRKHDAIEEHLRDFTAEEIWMCDLAIDVLAMLATSGGTRSDTHATVLDHLRMVDKQAGSHHWRREVHKAGDGPAEFRELRAQIPRHKPRG